jgi:serine/threonine-protein kinase HipA
MRVHVKYGDRLIGALDDGSSDGRIYFQYDRLFVPSGIELSPIHLPLHDRLQFHNNEAFERLPGLFYDSLPDKWGRGVLKARLEKQGINADNLSPLEKLCWVGSHGMGALTYEPDRSESELGTIKTLDLLRIARDAREILVGHYQNILPELLESGTSAGGARPKMLIGINREKPDLVIARAQDLPVDYDAWLLKIETDTLKEYCKLEYAYFRMAAAAGIDVPEVRLISQGGTSHFAIKRFDREGGRKIHVHSMAGLLHHDFNVYGSDYRDLFRLGSALTRDKNTELELFRRMAFNFDAGVRDDHAKNHAFLFDEKGWRLSPAYDLIYARGRGGAGQFLHELALGGKQNGIGRQDLVSFAAEVGLPSGKVVAILAEVVAACERWKIFAQEAKLTEAHADEVESLFEPFAL